ncbi:hypothetical protein ACFQ14_12745 [Pseudahrensia aquimaris]|uniref:Uncharacterized protein n=1 Tax=Pseudahrensia aquimaris TaxID=744461 RepID=A0ABW3FKB3_9HYPH
MDDLKMQRSNAIIGLIYTKLFEAGLGRVDLSIETVRISDCEILAKNRETWNADNRLFEDIVEWLAKEGAIYVGKKNVDVSKGIFVFDGGQLSAKGLSLLKNLDFSEFGDDKSDRLPQSENYSPGYYTKFGEFVGGALGGLAKVLANS